MALSPMGYVIHALGLLYTLVFFFSSLFFYFSLGVLSYNSSMTQVNECLN